MRTEKWLLMVDNVQATGDLCKSGSSGTVESKPDWGRSRKIPKRHWRIWVCTACLAVDRFREIDNTWKEECVKNYFFFIMGKIEQMYQLMGMIQSRRKNWCCRREKEGCWGWCQDLVHMWRCWLEAKAVGVWKKSREGQKDGAICLSVVNTMMGDCFSVPSDRRKQYYQLRMMGGGVRR